MVLDSLLNWKGALMQPSIIMPPQQNLVWTIDKINSTYKPELEISLNIPVK